MAGLRIVRAARGRARLCLAVAVCGAVPCWGADKALFIGNSLTFTNQPTGNIPAVVQQMGDAAGGGGDFAYTMVANAGWSLGPPTGAGNHWQDASAGGAHAKLGGGDYSIVVLQDYSFNATDNPEVPRAYVPLWVNEIRAKDPQATPYLFAAWQRQDRPGSQAAIDALYTDLAQQTGAVMVPVGDAWMRSLQLRPTLGLYSDAVHPTPAGSYLAGAVFYSMFYNTSPVGLAAPAGISASDALFMQTVAWEIAGTRMQTRKWNEGMLSGNWNVAGNWTPASVPGTGQDVALTASDGKARVATYINSAGANMPLNTLVLEGKGGGVFTLNQSQDVLRINTDMTLGKSAGGAGVYNLGGSGSLAVGTWRVGVEGTGSVTQTTGTAQGGGTLTLAENAGGRGTYTLLGGTLGATAAQVNTAGLLAVGGGSGSITALRQGGGMVRVDAGTLTAGTLAQTGGTLVVSGGTLNAGSMDTVNLTLSAGVLTGSLVNHGTFTFSGGLFSGQFINQGTALIQADFATAQAVSNQGVLESEAALAAAGTGILRNDPGAVISATGQIAAPVENYGRLSFSGNSSLSGGLSSSGTVEVRGGALNVSGAVPQFAGGTLTGGAWYLDAATADLGPQNLLTTNNSTITLRGGSRFIPLDGLTTNNGLLNLDSSQVVVVGIAAQFSNPGTVTIGALSTLVAYGTPSQVQDGTLTGGTWILRDGSVLTPDLGNITVNAARITLDGTSANWSNLWLSENRGSLQVSNGKTIWTPWDLVNTGTLTAGPGGTITIVGSLQSHGGVTGGGGTVAVWGDWNVHAPVACTRAGVIQVNGQVNLLNNATLDLGTTDLLVHATPDAFDAKFAALRAMILAGRHGGAWDGGAISSSAAAAAAALHGELTGLALVRARDLPGLSSFDGLWVDQNTILVKYTWVGDANLDGKIDFNDYLAIDTALLFGGPEGYAGGDFNYDGRVGMADYVLIDRAFLQQDSVLAGQMIALHEQWFGPAYGALVAVPEPASFALVAAGAAAALMRRRRTAR